MKKIVLVLFTVLISGTLFSQITNVRKWRKSEKDSLDMALLMYEEGLYLQALPVFEAINSHHPNEEFIRYSYAKCALFRSDKHEEAYEILSSIYAGNKRIDEIDYDVAKAAHFVTKLDEAMTAVNAYLAKRKLSPDNRAKGELLKRYITNAQALVARPTNARSQNMGPAINSEWEEYVPAVTSDESTIIFTYQGDKSQGGLLNDQSQSDPNGSYHEDLYISRKVNGAFAKAEPVSSINTDGNEAAIAISNDGSRLFVYRDNSDDHGDIYESRLVGGDYTPPVKLRGLVNSYSWDGHCSLSPDGRTMYFSSERGGGYGGRDIYRATMQQDSTWGNIVNLGDSVNSTFDEDAPFIHPDGVTLYFSSKGRNSMGGYDVFRAVMNPADSTFKRSDNLGYPINSTDDDIYFVVAANGKTAYYSSGKRGGLGLKDIYMVEPNFETSPALYLVKGVVKADGAPAEADIKVEQTSRGNALYGSFTANRVTGNYLIALPAGAAYKLTYTYRALPAQVLELDAAGLTAYTEKVNDINFVTPVAAAAVDTAAKATATLASAVKDSLVAGTATPTVTSSGPSKDKDGFVPQNSHQQKTLWYVDKYGDIRVDELVFKVQIGAFKNADNIVYPNLDGLGRIQKTTTEDGLIRVTIGGDFKTLRKAFDFNKKVIAAGQSDAFVTMIYKGKRVTLEDLEREGVFNKNKKGNTTPPAGKDTVGVVQPLRVPDAGSWIDLSGQVLLTQRFDQPAANLRLYLKAMDSEGILDSVRTDSSGRFRFAHVKKGALFRAVIETSDTALTGKAKFYLANGNVIYKTTKKAGNGLFAFNNLTDPLQPEPLADENEKRALSGSVLFQDNNSRLPLANSTLKLSNDLGDVVKYATTNVLGGFVFPGLPDNQNFDISLQEAGMPLPNNAKVVLTDKKGREVRSAVMQNGGFKFKILAAEKSVLKDMEVEEAELLMTIDGFLYDQDKNPVANAPLSVREEGSGNHYEWTTDANGRFRFKYLHSDRSFFLEPAEGTSLSSVTRIYVADSKRKVFRILELSGGRFSYQLQAVDKVELCHFDLNDPWLMALENGSDSLKIVENIFYATSDYNLNAEALALMDKAGLLLSSVPGISMEIISHTDSRGDDALNFQLSKKRAQTAVDYLVSKGIGRKRLRATGRGESQLINQCGNGVSCTEEEHKKNRRTEFRLQKSPLAGVK